MNIIVKSRALAEEYSKGRHDETSVVISIASKDQDNANVYCSAENGIKDILFMNFNDVSDEVSEGHITEEDAEQIKEFVEKYKDSNIDTMIVHCVAGQCRSAGVASAIALYLNGTDVPVLEHTTCVPNTLCKSKVLTALNGVTDYASIFGEKDSISRIL